MKRAIFIFLALSSFICLYVIFGLKFTLNFTFALFSFLFIVCIVFFTQKRKILNLIHNATQDELKVLADMYQTKAEKLEEEECWELQSFKEEATAQTQKNPPINKNSSEKIEMPKKPKFWENFNPNHAKIGAKIFFLPLRLIAYGFFIIGILLLIKHSLFDTFAFIAGLVSANILIVLWLFLY